ncbi:MAG TPA: ABC transporter permease [Candidatus Angelobacter sp.]|jgi:ABC-2 type transport system permease protein|nr:ABC transporter permease [Candidatus Angelobacter sp.]
MTKTSLSRSPDQSAAQEPERKLSYIVPKPVQPAAAGTQKGINWKAFNAMLARDVHVARRSAVPLLLQTLLQPLLFVFIFGTVMTRSGLMPESYKQVLLPGIVGLSMLTTGIQAVSMRLIMEFQFTREIEDRLLAPMEIGWVAIEKVVAGMMQAMISGAVVLPAGWLLMGRHVGLTLAQPLAFIAILVLVALFAACGGLAMGCSVGQTNIGLLFSLILLPVTMFGCVYYPWSALKSFPIMQKLVLLNPLVYASEGLRGTLAPSVPHMPLIVVIIVLAVADTGLIMLGLNRFYRKCIS